MHKGGVQKGVSMPRLARKDIKGHYFHIMTRGINKEFIFKNNKNKRLYLKYLCNHINWDNTTILGYVVMENHFHMLVHTRSILDISRAMSRVDTRFAKYYNKSKERRGYVFEGRFKVQPIVDRNHLYNCLTYIHKNPVKAKMVTHESEYPYSSYWEYLDEKYLTSDQSAQILFGTSDKKKFFNLYLAIHNKQFDYAYFEEDEEIDYKGFVKELKSRDINDKDIIKILHFVYKVPIFKIAKLTGFPKYFVSQVRREGPINKL